MRLAPPGANQNRAAFTLLELLAVIAIVAVLAGLAIGVGRRATDAGKTARARAELAVLAAALETYRRTHGDYPRTDDAAELLQALLGRRGPTGGATSGRPLIETARFTFDATQLLDPWGQPYRYLYKATNPWLNPGYVLYSPGPDGRDFSRLLAGGFPDTAGEGNADNLYAGR
jgi:general secretion pathway protein G